jgi:hypothetical protein
MADKNDVFSFLLSAASHTISTFFDFASAINNIDSKIRRKPKMHRGGFQIRG